MQTTQIPGASGKCGKCHRALKNPISTGRGYGPVCWGKVQADKERGKLDPADDSDYTYAFDGTGAESVLVITDLDRGRKSVTNNMYAVLARIASREGTRLTMPIVYRDSAGDYDGVRISETGAISFHPLAMGQRVTNRQEAIQAALKGETA
jgi:hypothetical protein